MRTQPGRSLVLVALLAVGAALAQTPGPSPAPEHRNSGAVEAERAARRHPQPVRAGDLPGRRLLGPSEDQPVLGRVAGVVRRPDGGAGLLVRLGGPLGLGWYGARLVSVPVEAAALLGEHVALIDLTPEQLRALPTSAADAAKAVAPDEVLRVGIVRPFH